MRTDLVEVAPKQIGSRHRVPQSARVPAIGGEGSSPACANIGWCRLPRTQSSSCSTASTATCSALRRRRVRHAEPRSLRGAVGALHRATTPARCRACPARHDILCGALDFLWKPWGSVEIWEDAITAIAASAGVTTMLVSDHPHLFETGGENYHTDFTGWDYERGHENDPWKTRARSELGGSPGVRAWHPRCTTYDRRGRGSGARTTSRGLARWRGRGAVDRRRTPAGTTASCSSSTSSIRTSRSTRPSPGRRATTPTGRGRTSSGRPTCGGAVDRRGARRAPGPPDPRPVRRQALDDRPLVRPGARRARSQRPVATRPRSSSAPTTATTSARTATTSGASRPCRSFEPMGHIPLMVRVARRRRRRTCDALTTSVDLFATLADVFGVDVRQRTHGQSLRPAARGRRPPRCATGCSPAVWGREVHLVDRERRYCRAPVGDNAPISMWSNRWSTMPVRALLDPDELPLPDRPGRARPHARLDVPVIRQPFGAGDRLPFWAADPVHGEPPPRSCRGS